MSYEAKKCPHCDEVFRWGDKSKTPHNDKERTSFNAYWQLTWHMQDKHADQFFVCGRQYESPVGMYSGGAYWDDRGHCSYCGSLKPEIVLAAIEDGSAWLGATDKNYKIYVELPNPNAGKPYPVTSRNSPPAEGEADWIEATPEACEEHGFLPWGSSPMWFKLSPQSPRTNDKFYFQHFSAEQQLRFVELYNEGRMQFRDYQGGQMVTVPRGFYRLPFFMVAAAPVAAARAAGGDA